MAESSLKVISDMIDLKERNGRKKYTTGTNKSIHMMEKALKA